MAPSFPVLAMARCSLLISYCQSSWPVTNALGWSVPVTNALGCTRQAPPHYHSSEFTSCITVEHQHCRTILSRQSYETTNPCIQCVRTQPAGVLYVAVGGQGHPGPVARAVGLARTPSDARYAMCLVLVSHALGSWTWPGSPVTPGTPCVLYWCHMHRGLETVYASWCHMHQDLETVHHGAGRGDAGFVRCPEVEFANSSDNESSQSMFTHAHFSRNVSYCFKHYQPTIP
jgi:hypothetical protein